MPMREAVASKEEKKKVEDEVHDADAVVASIQGGAIRQPTM